MVLVGNPRPQSVKSKMPESEGVAYQWIPHRHCCVYVLYSDDSIAAA